MIPDLLVFEGGWISQTRRGGVLQGLCCGSFPGVDSGQIKADPCPVLILANRVGGAAPSVAALWSRIGLRRAPEPFHPSPAQRRSVRAGSDTGPGAISPRGRAAVMFTKLEQNWNVAVFAALLPARWLGTSDPARGLGKGQGQATAGLYREFRKAPLRPSDRRIYAPKAIA